MHRLASHRSLAKDCIHLAWFWVIPCCPGKEKGYGNMSWIIIFLHSQPTLIPKQSPNSYSNYSSTTPSRSLSLPHFPNSSTVTTISSTLLQTPIKCPPASSVSFYPLTLNRFSTLTLAFITSLSPTTNPSDSLLSRDSGVWWQPRPMLSVDSSAYASEMVSQMRYEVKNMCIGEDHNILQTFKGHRHNVIIAQQRKFPY